MFKFDLYSGVITDLETYNITEINGNNKNISTSNYDKVKFKINDKKLILKYNENPLNIGDKVKVIGLKKGKGKNSYLDIFAFNNFTALDNNITRISILHILFTSLLFIVCFISGFFFIALLFSNAMEYSFTNKSQSISAYGSLSFILGPKEMIKPFFLFFIW